VLAKNLGDGGGWILLKMEGIIEKRIVVFDRKSLPGSLQNS
jgi:hypothetical protein